MGPLGLTDTGDDEGHLGGVRGKDGECEECISDHGASRTLCTIICIRCKPSTVFERAVCSLMSHLSDFSSSVPWQEPCCVHFGSPVAGPGDL